MMNETQNAVTSWSFGDNLVRTVKGNDGEPWFVGKDVATALGYSNVRDAIAKHVDEDDKRGSQIATPGGKQEAVIINESGLYSLIFGSKLDEAKKFKKWVTSSHCSMKRSATSPVSTGMFVTGIAMILSPIIDFGAKVRKVFELLCY